MKKFRFSLQPVGTLRDLQEMRASESFSQANRERAQCDAALQHQQLRVAEFVESLIVRRAVGLPGPMQDSFMRAYRTELVDEKSASDAQVAATKVQEAARQRWIEAHRQVKLIDKLRARAREHFQTEVFRFEQRQLDDRQPRGNLLSQP